MPTYSYKARDGSNQLVEGVMEGAGVGAVVDVLRGQGLMPVHIRETKAKAEKPLGSGLSIFTPTISHIDLLLFSRQMHTLLKQCIFVASPLPLPMLRYIKPLWELKTQYSGNTMKKLWAPLMS